MAPIAPPQVLVLPSNRPRNRSFKGGDRITSYRGEKEQEPYTPEDWVASTTCCNGHASLGLTTLPNGKLLVEEIESDPENWLGLEHLKEFGVDTKLLVKLLHAGQRVPVHAHPSGAFASKHGLGLHGKAEAWYILEPGEVFLGLKRDVSHAELQSLMGKQDVETMLGLLYRFPVSAGQTIYIPAGLLHAIGQGVLLLEVQEPSDLSVILEWRDLRLDGAKDGHLGLGFDTALHAVETSKRSEEDVKALIGKEDSFGDILPLDASSFFRFERVRLDGDYHCSACFSILVVLDGKVEIISGSDQSTVADKGSTVLIPFAAGPLAVRGDGEVMFVRPPNYKSDRSGEGNK